MIDVTRGDILQADAEALVNTVNCVGFMGRGIAAQFKRAYPKNFAAYAQACKRHEVQPGRMLIVETGRLTNPRWVVNFPTKRHWRGDSRIEDIDSGLAALIADVGRLGIKSIAVPPIAAAWVASPGPRFGRGSSRRSPRCPRSRSSCSSPRVRRPQRRWPGRPRCPR